MKLTALIIAVALTGCATAPQNGPVALSTYEPVVDMSRCNNCDYANDLYQCKAIAANNTRYMANAATNAAVGAAVGAIFGAILGLDVGLLAGAGAAGGALGGLGNESLTVNQMIVRCMTGRGYVVLR
ncbi:MAG: hypothetical protein IPI17_02570 [Nitrosomonas sp.]|nr:hypothetical protein [Nitrosomonas sp.]